jgi:hypothetical protein
MENQPKVRKCLDCDKPAGGYRSPYWCVEHDKERIERITQQLEQIAKDFGART